MKQGLSKLLENNDPLLVQLLKSMQMCIRDRDNGKCIGYAGFWNVSGEGDITNVAVLPEYRKNGIGSMLISEMIKTAVTLKLELLTLEVRKSNIAVSYTHLGTVFYFLLFSKWILKLFLFIFENILKFTKFIFKILLTPPKFLYKILIVPIIGVIKNKRRKGHDTHDE